MAEISNTVTIGFILTTLLTLWFFYKASQNKKLMLGIAIWMIVVGMLGFNGFYRVVDTSPPRFVFLLGPVFIFIILVFITKSGRKFIDQLQLKWLTIIHIIRIPIEIVLLYVFIEGFIPKLMTFEGYNYDILSGISAPVIYYLVFFKKSMSRKGLLIWNFVCLALLFNILTIAILSAETPFQQFAFDQPNIGVTYFPFVWLPTVVVPIVLLSHLASIRKLIYFKTDL